MKTAAIPTVWLLTTVLLSLYAPCVFAESKEGDKAAEVKKDEQDDDDRVSEVAITGNVALNPLGKNGEIPAVAGKIVENGVTYLLKLTDPKLQRERLTKVGDELVRLRGVLSDDKKYLTDTDVDIDTSPSVISLPSEGL